MRASSAPVSTRYRFPGRALSVSTSTSSHALILSLTAETTDRPLGSPPVVVDPVKVADAPNVAFAEMICSTLRSNGIETFFKRSSWGVYPGRSTDDFGPATIWVSEPNADRARELLAE